MGKIYKKYDKNKSKESNFKLNNKSSKNKIISDSTSKVVSSKTKIYKNQNLKVKEIIKMLINF